MEKMRMCLNTMNVKITNNDPTRKFNALIWKCVNNANNLLTTREKFNLKVSNPSIPILYGLVKLHKENNPLRPIASSCQAPAQLLSKY